MEIVNEALGRKFKLPVGYRFDPTDDILVGYYLREKIFNQPLPNNLIRDCDVFQTEPWNLPGGGKHMNWQKFVFYDTNSRVFEEPEKRSAGNGEWRMVEIGQDVELSNSENGVGKKNILVFWEANGDCFTKTNWVMHELFLVPKSNSHLMSTLAVYRILETKDKRKKMKTKMTKKVSSNKNNNNGGKVVDVTPTVIDFKMESGSVTAPPSPISP